MAKKKDKQPEPEPEPQEEEVTCPVCGKPVGLEVAACPNCGAEFEEDEVLEEVEQPSEPEEAKPGPSPIAPTRPAVQPEVQPAEEAAVEPVSEEDTAECPVCGKSVSLAVNSCPNCGAEFEEEEVEEVIEVEERQEEEVAAPVARHEVVREVPVVEEQEEVSLPHASSIADLRVIGIALIILGILGSQISAMIDWYWSWVPPIKTHLGMFVAIPAVIIVVGLVVYMLVKKSLSSGKKVPNMMPNFSLALFLFGILALILVMLWDPINSALQSSKIGMAGAFVLLLIVGVVSVIMGQRMMEKSAARTA